MRGDAYRLWQQWQQMHYPRRGLPEDEATRADLIAVDGTSGPALERYFRRRAGARAFDAEARASVEHCGHELARLSGGLHADAERYFGRLQQLIELVAVDAAGGATADALSAPSSRQPAER
jgi:hypothetical protein